MKTTKYERKTAQPECARSMALFGYREKHQDTAVGKCLRCGAAVKLNPMSRGVADYIGSVRTRFGPISYAVEVKAHAHRFDFNSMMEADQFTWLGRWQEDFAGVAWIWLLMGAGDADSRLPTARQTWLIPFDYWNKIAEAVKASGSSSISYLPSRLKRESGMYAKRVFAPFALEYKTGRFWWPRATHVFWQVYSLPYRPIEDYQTQNFTSLI